MAEGRCWPGVTVRRGCVSAPAPSATAVLPAGWHARCLLAHVSRKGPGHAVPAPAALGGCEKGNGIADAPKHSRRPALPLRPGGVGDPAQEEQAAGAVLVDEEQEGPVDAEADLGGQRHEPHGGHGCGLRALLIHRDGALVFELRRAQGRIRSRGHTRGRAQSCVSSREGAGWRGRPRLSGSGQLSGLSAHPSAKLGSCCVRG